MKPSDLVSAQGGLPQHDRRSACSWCVGSEEELPDIAVPGIMLSGNGVVVDSRPRDNEDDRIDVTKLFADVRRPPHVDQRHNIVVDHGGHEDDQHRYRAAA